MRQLRALALLLGTLLSPAIALAQGTLTGRIVNQAGEPIVGARIAVSGTSLRAETNRNGEYRLVTVPAGEQNILATMLGYAPRQQRVTVVSGQATGASFTMAQTALQLGGIVVTATGREQNTREIGSSVGVINTSDLQMAPITSASQLLQGRIPGVVVTQSSGATGGGARVRIRGNNSMSLSNAPLIIVDGIRVESSETGRTANNFGVGGQEPSRFNDLNPEDIESIEVLKGPAAAALYGTAAANGVIQVTTKRGHAGDAQFRIWSEAGRLDQRAKFPDNVISVGNLVVRNAAGAIVPAATPTGRCDNIRLAIGSTPTGSQIGCTGVTTTYRFNPIEAGGTDFFDTGNRRSLGGSVSGGSEGTTFYVSSDYDQERGVLPMNSLKRMRVQANTQGQIGSKLTVGANVSYLDNRQELPNSDNALFGILPMGLYGSALPANVTATRGFQADPGFFFDWRTFQTFARIEGAVRTEYRPLSWLTVNGLAGIDRYARQDRNRIPRVGAYNAFGDVYTNGWIQNYDIDIHDLTTNASATAMFDVRPTIVSTTSVGGQYIGENQNRIYAFGAGLTPGIETSLAGATSDFETTEANVVNATLSSYFQQQLAWRDRVFVNAAVRADKNTAFGQNIGWIAYPSVSGSWLVSDESFFPTLNGLSSLRLRAAYGQAGLRPGPQDALQAFVSEIVPLAGTDEAAIAFNTVATGTLGNPDLKPERSSEWEIGLESQMFDGRFGLELNYFRKTSHDALVRRQVAPSAGSSPGRFENLGQVDNNGLEYKFSAQVLRRPNLDWNVNLGGSFLKNVLTSIGTDALGQTNPPVILGLASTQRHVQGYALGSYWQVPITGYADANGDGLLGPNEVTVGTTPVYLGNPFPKRELSFSSDVNLWKAAKLSALVDYKGGFQLLNLTRGQRCSTRDKFNCAELYDRNTPLDLQAASVARTQFATWAGFVEDADFVKLREIALTLSVPDRFARRVAAGGLHLTFAGRNLATWTKYTGLDPELNYGGQNNFNTADAGTLPPNRIYQIRIDAAF